MTALLGLLAVAGYQNRDKLSEMFANRGGQGAGGTGGGLGGLLGGALGGGSGRASGLEGLLGSLGMGGSGTGKILGNGLSELSDRFQQNGHAETVNSWVGKGPNRDVAPQDLEKALGPDALDDLTEHTGLTRDEILSRLSRELPSAVDRYTPQGQLPKETDFS